MIMSEPQTFTVLRGTLSRNVSLARYTSWRCGGAGDRLYIPADRDDLAAFIRQLPAGEPLTVIGLGSNLLVRDGGVRGTIVVLHAALVTLELVDGLIHAEAGVTSPKVARFAATHGLAGAEFLAGIPGTIGGALAMNAGCYGGETWRHVARVEVVTRGGAIAVEPASRYATGYRTVRRADGSLPDAVFTAAWFSFPQRRRSRRARADRGALAPANRDAAAQPAERRQRLPQSARRPRGAPDRELRPQRLRDRRRARVGEAREFHRQPGRRGRRPPISRRSSRTSDRRCASVPVSTSFPKCRS